MTIAELYNLFLQYPVVCTDTRKIRPSSLFFALKGQNFDGNIFAAKALQQGAAFAIIDSEQYKLSEQYIVVSDVLQTLQNLATYHRKQLTNTTVIVIGGSNGKTTSKELIYRVLQKKYNTYATLENLNNHIGVPLSILQITQQQLYAVIEIGANAANEHTLLCNITQPNYALLTNIGKDHLEGYESFEKTIQAYSEIYAYCNTHQLPIFLNTDDTLLTSIATGLQVIPYSKTNSFIEQDFPHLILNINNNYVQTNLVGSINFYNVVAAFTIGVFFNIPNKQIIDAIENYTPTNNRSQIANWKGNTLLLDAYNANPSSMEAMLADFGKFNHPKKIAILGDMLELGEFSFQEHKAIINQLLTLHLHQVILVGTEFAKHPSPYTHLPNTTQLISHLQQNPLNNCFILIKASRGIALEKAFT